MIRVTVSETHCKDAVYVTPRIVSMLSPYVTYLLVEERIKNYCSYDDALLTVSWRAIRISELCGSFIKSVPFVWDGFVDNSGDSESQGGLW